MTSRIPAALLAAASLVALAFAIARASYATAAPPGRWIAADAAAQSHGIRGFEVLADAPRALDVRLAPPGALHVRVGAESTEQQVTGSGAPFVVRTQRDALALGSAGAERIVARRDRGDHRDGDRDGWSGELLNASEAAALARVLALDVALAVQGTSLVFDRSSYVSCTQRCQRAEVCAQRSRQAARCADDIVVCAACLERAP